MEKDEFALKVELLCNNAQRIVGYIQDGLIDPNQMAWDNILSNEGKEILRLSKEIEEELDHVAFIMKSFG